MQEARFAGACQDQHAGRPAPNLGWPGERKSIVQQAETSVVSRNETNQGCGAWGPGSQGLGAQGLGPGPPGLGKRLKRLPRRWGPGKKRARDTPPTPPPRPPPSPAFLGCKGEKKRVFTLSVTETIQHAPLGRRTFEGLGNDSNQNSTWAPITPPCPVVVPWPVVWALRIMLGVCKSL